MARGASPTPLEHDPISSLPYTRTTPRATRTTPRNTRISPRTIRTIHIRSPPHGGLLIWLVLMVLEVILVFLGVVLVVLEVVLVYGSELTRSGSEGVELLFRVL